MEILSFLDRTRRGGPSVDRTLSSESDSDCDSVGTAATNESTFDHVDLSTGPEPCYLSDQYTE